MWTDKIIIFRRILSTVYSGQKKRERERKKLEKNAFNTFYD